MMLDDCGYIFHVEVQHAHGPHEHKVVPAPGQGGHADIVRNVIPAFCPSEIRELLRFFTRHRTLLLSLGGEVRNEAAPSVCCDWGSARSVPGIRRRYCPHP